MSICKIILKEHGKFKRKEEVDKKQEVEKHNGQTTEAEYTVKLYKRVNMIIKVNSYFPVFSVQATDGDAGTFGIVRYYFSDEPDQ